MNFFFPWKGQISKKCMWFSFRKVHLFQKFSVECNEICKYFFTNFLHILCWKKILVYSQPKAELYQNQPNKKWCSLARNRQSTLTACRPSTADLLWQSGHVALDHVYVRDPLFLGRGSPPRLWYRSLQHKPISGSRANDLWMEPADQLSIW